MVSQRGSHDNNLHVYLDATETRECWCDLCWHRPLGLRRACVALVAARARAAWRAVTCRHADTAWTLQLSFV